MQNNGKYIQFRCQNTPSPVYRDRIWMNESPNGLTSWSNDRIVVEGTSETAQDDLSCSPGVVIAPSGIWHMYYVTAARATVCTIEMWHATSPDGVTWTKLGKISSVPVSDCSLVEPSPIIEGNKIAVYFPVNWGNPKSFSYLWRMESDIADGHNFSMPVRVPCPENFFGGRVSKSGSTYYLAYSFSLDGTAKIPDSVYLSVSEGVYPPVFKDGYKVGQITNGKFYATQMMAGNFFDNRMYISGNYMPLCKDVTPPTPCSDYPNAIGVLLNVPVLTPTATPTPTPTATKTPTPQGTPTPCIDQPGPGGIGTCPTPTPGGPTPTPPATLTPTRTFTPTPPPNSTPTPCIDQPGPGGIGTCPTPTPGIPPTFTPTPVVTPTATLVPTPTVTPGGPTPTPTPIPPPSTSGLSFSPPVTFEPNPPGPAGPRPIYLSSGFSSNSRPYFDSVQGRPMLMMQESFGYSSLDISNKTSPQVWKWDYLVQQGMYIAGDGQSYVQFIGVSEDGQRAAFSCNGPGEQWGTTFGVNDNGFGFSIKENTNVRGAVVIKKYGSRYIAYQITYGSMFATDITSLPGHTLVNYGATIPFEKVAAGGEGGTFLFTTDRYLVFTEATGNIRIVDTSNPGAIGSIGVNFKSIVVPSSLSYFGGRGLGNVRAFYDSSDGKLWLLVPVMPVPPSRFGSFGLVYVTQDGSGNFNSLTTVGTLFNLPTAGLSYSSSDFSNSFITKKNGKIQVVMSGNTNLGYNFFPATADTWGQPVTAIPFPREMAASVETQYVDKDSSSVYAYAATGGSATVTVITFTSTPASKIVIK
jgi:hypothetical protein